MLIPPYFTKATQEGISEYFAEFIAKVKMPVVIYDVPYYTGIYLDPGTIKKIAEENKMIIGIKACNTNFSHFTKLVILVKDKISVLSGDEYLFIPEVILGAKGVIPASANVFPHHLVKIFEMTCAGDIDGAKRLYLRLVPVLEALFAETNPGPIKEAMAMVGFDVGHVLRPLKKPNKENLSRLREAVQAFQKTPIDA